MAGLWGRLGNLRGGLVSWRGTGKGWRIGLGGMRLWRVRVKRVRL